MGLYITIKKISKPGMNAVFIAITAFFLSINFSFANPSVENNPAKTLYKKMSPSAGIGNVQMVHITSGTGFFVTKNEIITNEHVVHNCSHIRVRGAVDPGYAYLIDTDKAKDLALLRTIKPARAVAPLRGDMPVKIGESVNVMGYPLERGIKGTYLIRKATITNNRDIYGGVERIQFTDSVEKGNSGGPLLDTSGTVIGVIVGKMSFYPADSDTLNTAPIKTSSVAITLNTLKNFLTKNKVFFHTDNINYAFSDAYMENKAKDYIVNVQCVKKDDAPK